MPDILLILDNIRSTHNVGSILRTADGFGVKQVYYCGYTPYPAVPHDNRLPHESAKIIRAIHKTALGAEATLSGSLFAETKQAISHAKQLGYTVAALEQSTRSTALATYTPPHKVALILGNEVDGMNSDTLSTCDVILEIPMFGTKESFNVSIAAAICLYELSGARTYAE
jgi:23S rRNA (guanosine2251-2'-O)-methyltransferase